jgi:hypothetical protein
MNSRRPKLDRMCLPGLRTATSILLEMAIAVRGSVAYFAVHRETTLEGRLVAPGVSAGTSVLWLLSNEQRTQRRRAVQGSRVKNDPKLPIGTQICCDAQQSSLPCGSV